jgi:hypothetical protein
MPLEFRLAELSVVVLAESHNPTILNPDFLKRHGVVPEEAELAAPAITTPAFSRVAFADGVSLTAEAARMIFSENLIGKPLEEASVPRMANRYVELLPHVGYSAVGINPGGHAVAASQEAANAFVRERMLSDGPWKDFGEGITRAALTLHYPRNDGHLSVSVDAAQLVTGEHVVSFAANRHHQVARLDEPATDRAEQLRTAIDGWKEDIDAFRDLCEQIIGH